MDACSDGKESACNTGDLGSIPGLGRSPGGGHGNALQCSCLENSKDEEPGWAIVHVAMKSEKPLRDSHFHMLWIRTNFTKTEK